jgi:dTMP kinase
MYDRKTGAETTVSSRWVTALASRGSPRCQVGAWACGEPHQQPWREDGPVSPVQPAFGRFVVIDGGEGAGKTTQIEAVRTRVDHLGLTAVVTREPGGTSFGQQVRQMLLDPHTGDLPKKAEALLFAADRAYHVETVIRPALEAGHVVLCDRFIDSTVAYQGHGRGLSPSMLRLVSRWAADTLEPDLTVLLDIPPQIGLARVGGRGPADRIETEDIDFHQRVRDGFTTIAASRNARDGRYLVLDATSPAGQITDQIWTKLLPFLLNNTRRTADARQ